jgi:hypothetical protein
MKTINNYWTLAAAFFLLIHCSNTPMLTGGASGTEISACVISGVIVDSCSKPVPGCLVRLRPHDYIAGVDSILPGIMQDDTTDTAGRFSMDSVPPGQYCIEYTFAESLGRSIDFAVDSAESIKVFEPEIIKSMAMIYGDNLPLTSQDTSVASAANPSVQLIGFERATLITNAGHFEMKVPPGWCRLNLQGIDTIRYNGNTIFYVMPGKQYSITPSQNFLLPCDSLACEMAHVQEILDSNGLQSLSPESVTVVESGHVVELRLHGRGLRVLPSAVCWLWRLHVLDIGKNSLHEIPLGIGNLRRLTAFLADSNFLWYVPASVGMLISLRELDLSYNQLQSLPDPITSLVPTKRLLLDGNMLCNLGSFTEHWANKYALGWQEQQHCW